MKNGMKQTEIGEIPVEWEVAKLGKFGNSIRGVSYKPGDLIDELADAVIILRSNNIADGSLNYDDVKLVTRKNVSQKQLLKKGDIAICMSNGSKRLVGKSARYNQSSYSEVSVGAFCSFFRTNSSADDRYIFQLFQSDLYQKQIDLELAGSAINNLKDSSINGLVFGFPPLPEQRKIAEILSTLDEKMAVMDEQLAQTQELKKGLMQHLLTKGIGHTQFKDSPLGEIPASWEVAKLGEAARIERGKFQQRPRNDPRFFGGQYPFVQTGDIGRANGRITTYSQTLNELGLSVSRLFPVGTLVITIAANIGDVAIAQFEVAFPDSLVGIVADDKKLNNLFLMYYLATQKEELNKLAPQSAQKNINLETLRPYKMPLPPLPEQRQIAEILTTVDEKIGVLQDKKAQYQTLKRGLMQQLLTGQRRVPALETAVLV